jgi:glycosyltransferase involved in cell wall biosynthesis
MKTLISNPRVKEETVPTISVAMPVYNGERYLCEAIDSILNQTFSDFELIIIDDGSTDNSLQVLQAYQKLDPRIHLIARENRNLATTLNDIIDLANGKWIARMDQDDIALPQRFERQLDWLEQTGADICGSWVKLFGTRDQRILKHPQRDDAIKMEMLFSTPFAHPTVMMRTQLVKKLRYDKVWEKCEDYDLWERAARAGWKMSNVQEVLLLYRQHLTQITTHTFNQNQILSQHIKRRYHEFIFDSFQLPIDWVDEIIKIRDLAPATNPNMDKVDLAFHALLSRNQGEAQLVVFDHVTRLYFRVAANTSDVVARWGHLNEDFGVNRGISTKIKLWLLSVFRIHPNSAIFSHLKKIVFSIVG